MPRIKAGLILFMILVAFPCTSNAEGWRDLRGVTKDDWQIYVKGECCAEGETQEGYRTMGVYLQRRHNGQRVYESYPSEKCQISWDEMRHRKLVSTFKCMATGKSPLAGLIYETKPHPTDKGQCDYVFLCKSGCGPKSKAPLKLIKPGEDCY